MKSGRLIASASAIVSLGVPASAHRLDEYLQATMFSVEQGRVQAEMRLTPGVAVSSFVVRGIDTDADGVISETEQRAYAERVLLDGMFTIDGQLLRPELVSMEFPTVEQMKEGLGEIRIEFGADLPRGGPNRRLTFENHHQSLIAAYLVNCLVPNNPNIRVLTQNRNEQQSFYQLDYVDAAVSSSALRSGWEGGRGWLGIAALVLFARFAYLWRRRRINASLLSPGTPSA